MRSFPFLVTSLLVILLASCAAVAGEVTPRPSSTPIVLFHFNPASATPKTETPVASPEPSLTPNPTPNNFPDLAGQTISLAFLCDRSGPLAETDAARMAGATDAVAYINSNGGIFGAQLDLQFGDTQGTVEEAQRAEARLMRESPDVLLVLVCDSLSEGALVATLNEDKIPALAPGDFASPGGFIFGLDAAPEQQFSFWLADLVANWANRKPDGSGSEIHLAILNWPAELAGPVTTPDTLAYAESLGVQVVLQKELAPNNTDGIFDFLYEARDEEVNAIYTNARSLGLAALLNGIGNLGLHGRFVLGAPAASYDTDVYTYLPDPTFASDLYLTSSWAWWSDADTPGVQFTKDLLASSSFQPEWADWGYMQMVGAVDIARKTLQDVILESGFDQLDRANVVAALQNLDSYAVLGDVCLVNYSDGSRLPSQLAVWQVGAIPGELTVATSLSPIPTPAPNP